MNFRLFAKTTIAIALTAFAFASCNRDRNKPDDPHYGRGDEEQQPTTGLSVSASYYGDYYEKGFQDYILLFQLGEIDANGAFANSGVELSLEILTSNGGPSLFPAGIYELTNDQFNSAGIVPSIEGKDDDNNITYGDTYLYTQQDADNYWLEPLEAAHLEVEMNGAQYTISVKITVGGEEYSYLYKGALAIEDMREDPSTEEDGPDGDYDFKADKAYAWNLGDAWSSDTDDWEFEFDNSKNPNEWISVEIIAAAASNIEEIPTGTFSIPADFVNNPIVPNTLVPTGQWYEDSDDYCGTYYGHGTGVWYWAESGSLKITKSGDDYTFELSFNDNGTEDYDPAKVTMTYTGKVEVDTSFANQEDEGNALRLMKKATPSAKVKFGRKHTHKRQTKAASKFACRLR